jgi:hypothetical protein
LVLVIDHGGVRRLVFDSHSLRRDQGIRRYKANACPAKRRRQKLKVKSQKSKVKSQKAKVKSQKLN